MSFARAVIEIEPTRLDWLTIEDSDDRIWQYRRIGMADLAEAADVEGHLKNGHPFRAGLVRDNDGHPMLQQDGPGLPAQLDSRVHRGSFQPRT